MEEELSGEKIDHNDGHTVLQGKVLKRRLRLQNYLTTCFRPEWQERYLALRGFYLFRLAAQEGETIAETNIDDLRTKGSPIPVSEVKMTVVDDSYDEDGYEVNEFGLCLATLRKSYMFSFETADEREKWVKALKEQRQKVIKQKLGHAPIEDWEKVTNALGKEMIGRSVKKEVASSNIVNTTQQAMSYF